MLIRSFTYSLLTRLGVGFISLLILVSSSRYLGVTSRGEISIFLLNLMLMQILNEVYTGYSLIHFVPKSNWKKLVVGGILYTFLNTALCNALVIVLQRQVAGYEHLGYVLSVLVMLNTFNCVLLLARQNIRAYNVLSVFQPLLLLLGILYYIFVRNDYRFSAYVYPMFFSFLIAWLLSTCLLFFKYPLSDSKAAFRLGPILTNGFLYQLGLGMIVVCNRVSYYLLSDHKSVGLYASVCAIAESVLIISNGVSTVLLSRVANNNLNESKETILSVAKAAGLLSIAVVLGLCLLPETFWLFVFGADFVGLRDLLRIYAPAVVLLVFANVIANFFIANGQQKNTLIPNALGFGASLLFSPFLVNHYGPTGAALNALIAYCIIAFSMTIIFLRKNHMPLHQVFQVRADYQRIRALILSALATNNRQH